MNYHHITISKSALQHNIKIFRKVSPQTLFLAVVKSNAYGHGMKEVVHAIADKVDYFGVNSLTEAFQLVEITKKTPILVMGLNGTELSDIQKKEINPDYLQRIQFVLSNLNIMKDFFYKKGLHFPFHIKIDTGLSRLGLSHKAMTSCLDFIKESHHLSCNGIMTHFANVEDVNDQSYANSQLLLFQNACEQMKIITNQKTILCHAAASAASLLLPQARMDMIRIGISLYGLWPSSQTRLSFLAQNSSIGKQLELRPVLSWYSRIVHINRVKHGSYIGYGCTYRAEQDINVGIISIGYYEGYDRDLSNRNTYVLLHGKRAMLLGRISMNMTCVDLSLIQEAKIGDEVTLIGKNGKEEISVDSLAGKTNSINYEIVTRLHPSIPRLLVK